MKVIPDTGGGAMLCGAELLWIAALFAADPVPAPVDAGSIVADINPSTWTTGRVLPRPPPPIPPISVESLPPAARARFAAWRVDPVHTSDEDLAALDAALGDAPSVEGYALRGALTAQRALQRALDAAWTRPPQVCVTRAPEESPLRSRSLPEGLAWCPTVDMSAALAAWAHLEHAPPALRAWAQNAEAAAVGNRGATPFSPSRAHALYVQVLANPDASAEVRAHAALGLGMLDWWSPDEREAHEAERLSSLFLAVAGPANVARYAWPLLVERLREAGRTEDAVQSGLRALRIDLADARDALMGETVRAIAEAGITARFAVGRDTGSPADHAVLLMKAAARWLDEGDLAWAREAVDAALAIDPSQATSPTVAAVRAANRTDETPAQWAQRVVKRCADAGRTHTGATLDGGTMAAIELTLAHLTDGPAPGAVAYRVVEQDMPTLPPLQDVSPDLYQCLMRGPHPPPEGKGVESVRVHVQLHADALR